MSDKTSDLKPCPFCGGEAIIRIVEPHTHRIKRASILLDYPGGAFIECNNCTCAMSGETEYEVVAAWNQRKPMERILELLNESYDRLHKRYITSRDLIDLGKKYGLEIAIEIVKEEGVLNDER